MMTPVALTPRRLSAALGLPLFAGALVAVALVYREPLAALLRSAETVRDWVNGFGWWAPVVFMALQVIQVVVFVIPGEAVQLAGGFAFGLWRGSLWSVLGIMAGSLLNYAVGHWLGRPFVAALFGEAKLAQVEAATSGGKALAGFLLLFAIPGLPKDALTYVAGTSGLGFWRFLWVSGLGRLPGIVGSAYIGAAVYQRAYLPAVVVGGLATALFVLGLLFRKRLQTLIQAVAAAADRLAGGGRGGSP